MKILWANQKFDVSQIPSPSIFLAGPTPRSSEVRSWRPDAITHFKQLDFQGTVFIPEDEKGKWQHSYIEQVEWEEKALTAATVIVFWVPRNLKTMPAFTTNVEWGTWHKSGKVVLGAPDDAPKMSYLRHYAKKYGIPTANNLEDTLKNAIELSKREQVCRCSPYGHTIKVDDNGAINVILYNDISG
jgi:hypothetical protein